MIFAPPSGGFGMPAFNPGTGTRFAWGGGFQLGAYYMSDYHWNFGLSFKSPQWFEPLRYNSNDVQGNPVQETVNAGLPLMVGLGAAYSGFDRWLYAVDVRYFDFANAPRSAPRG